MNLTKAHLVVFTTIFANFFTYHLPAIEYSGASYGSSSKVLNIARAAKRAIESEDNSDIKRGIELLELAIEDSSFNRLSPDSQVSVFLDLTAGYQKNGQRAKEESLLSKLLSINRFKSHWIKIKSHLIISLIRQERLDEAEALLETLSTISSKNISGEEREMINSLIDKLSKHYEQLLTSAEDKFQKKLYNDTIYLLRPVIQVFKRKQLSLTQSKEELLDMHTKVLFRIGASYLAIGDYENAISCLEDGKRLSLQSQKLSSVNKDITLFLGRAYQRKKMKEKALDVYDEFLQKHTLQDEIGKTILLEASEIAFRLEKFQIAKNYLLKIEEKRVEKELLLAKISLEEGKYEDALKYLENELFLNLPPLDQMFLESSFIRGVVLAKKRDIEQAIIFLEQSCPAHLRENLVWREEAWILLGKIYLNLASQNESSFDVCKVYLDRSEACFCDLYKKRQTKDVVLGLAALYFSRFSLLKEELAKSQFRALILRHKDELSEKQKMLLDLLCIDVTSNHEERVNLYEALIKDSKDSFLHDKALLSYAMALIQSLQNVSDLNERKSIEERAKAYLFEVEHREITPSNAYLIFEVAKGYLLLSDNSLHKKATDLLEEILKYEVIEQETILFYLHSSLAIRSHEGDNIRKRGIEVGAQLLEKYPNNQNVPIVKHREVILLYEDGDINGASKIASELLNGYPNYEKRPDILYLMAAISDSIDSQYEKAREYRKELYTLYPTFYGADESYFRIFPENEYLVGASHAIAHLREMESKFPISLYLIPANYYLAGYFKKEGEKKQYEERLDRLNNAALTFLNVHKLYKETPKNNLPLAKYLESLDISALLKAASLYLKCEALAPSNKIYYLESSKECLNLLLPSLEFRMENNKDEIHSQILSIYQEGNYLLSLVYEKMGLMSEARRQLEFLIEWTSNRGIQGEFVARAYLQLAILEVNHDKFDQAFELFKLSESALNGKSGELLLEIEIEKSQLFRKMGKLDLAMTLLSQVINDDIASSLRIKAMLLRAEIYELQKRRDLAIKQLEAAQKKGGDWGEKAKKKLEEMYGYK